MTLEKDFEDFIALLNKHKVEYLVIGGYALAFHGRPRNTGDLDIWISISDNNAKKMIRVVSEFGFSSLGLTKNDFTTPGYITQLGYPPLRIDILTSIDGIEFADAIINKQVINVGGLPLHYIGLQDLITNKISSGRIQDLADIKELKKVEKSEIQKKPKLSQKVDNKLLPKKRVGKKKDKRPGF